ncbi:MAG: site-specific integrase [Gammaproteobacteria bacterium]|nr:site-specific integrase [Gammaproteobacteria bacterium]
MKKRITKKEFLASSPDDVEKFVFCYLSEDGEEVQHQIFFSNTSPSNRNFNRIPILYDEDSMAIERHSTLSLLTARKNRVHESTISSTAQSLEEFFNFCMKNKLNWKEPPRNRLNKPIYKYSKYLQELIYEGRITPRTAKRKVSDVIRFCKDCLNDYGDEFFGSYPPYTEKMTSFITPEKTMYYALSQEEQIRAPKEVSVDKHLYIEDGGKLKPLSASEHAVLSQILDNNKCKKNIEMRYIFKTALKTGARLQTILTLSTKDISVKLNLPSGYDDINHIIQAGKSYIADSKLSRNINIFMPYSWVQTLQVYINSPRYKKRLKLYFKNLGINNPSEEQKESAYIFLTNRGTPYYDRQADLKTFRPENSRSKARIGGGVHDYIANHILPQMRVILGEGYSFHFHDLRATYGINLRDQLKELYPNDIEEVYKQIQTRMSHKNRETTELYVKYDPNYSELMSLEHKYRQSIGYRNDK